MTLTVYPAVRIMKIKLTLSSYFLLIGPPPEYLQINSHIISFLNFKCILRNINLQDASSCMFP